MLFCLIALQLTPSLASAIGRTCYDIYVSYSRVFGATVASPSPGLYPVMCCALRKTAVLDEHDKG